ncbi:MULTISPECIES: cation:proton antiporter [Shewanella]|uniref:Monovalent cation/H(+) antiporter subunit G n=1 Tax=Shewanella psychromarinicola TaxID=2487742 RepID=A0A3N4E1A6_9GAMM|nr:monovalent cation/H(+) antiporter subunit G [Shewanella psychromarinicola]AZG33517.1 monovalent cation/H(+) antiporter subunit G [Shewanella psychromarinicola]MCL1082400.1 monovalent cation/H(+) antiporter subunit G [Shewanella psychromarinicola]RPA27790.1 monovalent cation/H(+) antiporter subunit G [Shewanella psychromarinicola]
MNIADSFSLLFCLVGLFFFFAGTVGLIRFPDVLSRLHAITKADNLGLGLIAIGLLPQLSSPTDALKLVLIWGLVIFSSAACSYLIASQVIEEQSPPHSVEDKS